MPTYDYICDDCNHEFEEFQAITADPLKKCPKCSGHVHRLIGGGSGVLFKGSGFYQTDYRSKGYQDSAKKEKEKTTPKKKESKPSSKSKKESHD